MKRVILSLALTLALATVAALAADAQQTQRGQTQQSPSDVIAAAFTAEVTGQVQSVDPQTGKLTLQTLDGTVTVRFPPAAVQTVKPGDTVTVAFGLVKPPPSASPPTAPGSKEQK